MKKKYSHILKRAVVVSLSAAILSTTAAGGAATWSVVYAKEAPDVADAAMYRGIVDSIFEEKGITTYELRQAEGTNYGYPILRVSVDKDTKVKNTDSIKEGDYLEVYYGNNQKNEWKTQKAISINKLMDATLSVFNGTIVEINKDDKSKGSLLLKDLDSENTILFQYSDKTQLYLNMDQVKKGDKLNIYYNGALTRSIPAQGNATEIRAYADYSIYRGNIDKITKKGTNTILTLKRAEGTPYSDKIEVTIDKNTKLSQSVSTLKKGNYLEIFYQTPKKASSAVTAVTVQKLLDSEICVYNGTLKEIIKDKEKEGAGTLVLTGSNQEEIWFHYVKETEFKTDLAKLKAGDKLSIYHRGAVTLSIPAQGGALSVSLLKK